MAKKQPPYSSCLPHLEQDALKPLLGDALQMQSPDVGRGRKPCPLLEIHDAFTHFLSSFLFRHRNEQQRYAPSPSPNNLLILQISPLVKRF